MKTSKNQHLLKVLMNERETTLQIDDMLNCDWVKVNPDLTGFYRVSYSKELIMQLQSAMSYLSAIDRLNLVNDLFALNTAGICSTTCFLDFLSVYKDEMDYAVWWDISFSISKISLLLQNTTCYNNFKCLVADLYRPVAEKLGWEPTDNEGFLFVFLLKSFLCYVLYIKSYYSI